MSYNVPDNWEDVEILVNDEWLKAKFINAGVLRIFNEPPEVWGDYFIEIESTIIYNDMEDFPEWRRIKSLN